MKKTFLPALVLLLAAAATAVAAGPSAPVAPARPDAPPCNGLSSYLATLPVEPLSDAEKAGLLFTREEEKLARDVYVALAAKWGDRVFTNIAASEQQHMDAVLFLLQRYELADPAAAAAPGVFADPRLASLYVALLEKGSLSLADAHFVGATIEDLDLADVEDLLEAADNADVDTVLQNLAKGSRNHLRSFVSLLEAEGVAYAPQYLDAAEFAAIVSTERETKVVYDAAGLPVEGIAPCAASGKPAWSGGSGPAGNAPGSPAGSPSGSTTGTGTCDGTGIPTGPAGSPNGNGGRP